MPPVLQTSAEIHSSFITTPAAASEYADLFKKTLLVKKSVKAGGKGRGRPNLAQAGTKSPEKIGEVLAERIIEDLINE